MMKRRFTFLLVTVFTLLTSVGRTVFSEDWPQFRGPGGGASVDDAEIPMTWSENENIVWKTKLPGPGASSPILMKDRIFLTCYSGYGPTVGLSGDISKLIRHVVCLNRDNGKIVWEKKMPAKQPEEKTIREDHGYATSTPVADDERVYVFFGKSGVFAFDHDGKPAWEANVGSNTGGWGSAASPMLYESLLIVNASVESESIVALNKNTGKEVWRAKNINEAWNTPLLVETENGQTELVAAKLGQVLGLDPRTGEQLWTCDTDIEWYMVPSLVAQDGIVYCIGGRSGGSLAVRAGGRGDVTKTHRLWKGRKGSNVSSPILHDGHLYWMHDDSGVAYCAEAKTGKVLYEERLAEDRVYASTVRAGSNLFCVARDGRTFVLAAKPKFELLATNNLDDGSTFNASPAIADGRLYIRSDKYLYCIGN
jgi:hypothetical protein